MWNGYSSKMLRDFLTCVLYVKTLGVSSMKIITVLGMIYKEICMAGQGKQKEKAAVVVTLLKTMAAMFISTISHS